MTAAVMVVRRTCLEPDFGQNAAFHDRMAAQYDHQLIRNPHNVLARDAFRDLVERYLPCGSTLLDFGCGTGLDAEHYAGRGYRVLAYDNSPGMVGQLRQRCAAQIAGGQIQTCSVPYPSFPARLPAWPAPQAIVANFAVLNSIRDLEPLFGHFTELLAPRGWLIVSVLNPIHWSKVRMPAWWRNALPHPTGPRLYMHQPYACYLHFVPGLLRAARGYTLVGRGRAGTLVRYYEVSQPHEPPSWWSPDGSPVAGLERILWQTSLRKWLGHFLFLVLRRDA
jgi:SAM-dependent methyltransferase